jgi:hypothetical protein
LVDGDAPHWEVVHGAAFPAAERGVRQRGRDVSLRHLRVHLPAPGKAEQELVGDELRGGHLSRERQARAGAPRDTSGSRRQPRQELARSARAHGPDGGLGHSVPAVGGVSDEPRVGQVRRRALPRDRVVRARHAPLLCRAGQPRCSPGDGTRWRACTDAPGT